MLEAWKPIIERLERYSAEWNKPILIPELGYRSAKGSTHHPWGYAPRSVVDEKEQENAYKAFIKAFLISLGSQAFFGGLILLHQNQAPDRIHDIHL